MANPAAIRAQARALIALAPGLLVASMTACSRTPAADTIYIHGVLYTLAGEAPRSVEDEPTATALAVRGGRIVAVGSDADVRRLAGRGTRIRDLEGATVVPGLVDAHLHIQSLGRSLREVNLVGTRSYDEVIERVRARAAETPPGEWVSGRGWDQNDWPEQRFPDHAALSAAIPDRPVYLRRVDGHAALVNARALELAGLTARTPDPAGGRIERRPDGSPAGVLVDRACDLVSSRIPAPSAAERRTRLRMALDHCAALGLTGVHDAGASGAEMDDARALLADGELRLRLYAMLGATQETDGGTGGSLLEHGPQPFDSTLHLAARTVKLVADGALGSRGAALLAPYSDAPGERGLLQYDLDAFLAIARPLHQAGFQLATHAIGDAANRLVLDAYETLERENPRPGARHRIEHAQVISPDDIGRFAALGVLPSMQPTHCTSDMPWAGARLGPERLQGAYAWRALRQTGVMLPAGSDAPVEDASPFLGIYAALTRQDLQGQPEGGWAPEQRLSRSEAMRAFTSWAAFASFTEADLGTLEVGKLADFTVLDRDVMRVAPPDIPATQVLLTVVGGVVVHEAAGRAIDSSSP